MTRLLPLDRRVVHLVDHDGDLGYARSLSERDMLARLSAFLEAGLELALARGDDEQRDVRLRSIRSARIPSIVHAKDRTCAAPEIILGTYVLCPGASRIVYRFESVSK